MSRGHREVPHTADTIVEAWGPSRAACFEEAVAGLAAVYAEVPAGAPITDHEVHLGPGADDTLLVELLSEALFLLDARDAVAVEADVEDAGDTVTARLGTAPASEVELVGAVPKAITYHQLEVVEDDDGWRCRVTLDL